MMQKSLWNFPEFAEKFELKFFNYCSFFLFNSYFRCIFKEIIYNEIKMYKKVHLRI